MVDWQAFAHEFFAIRTYPILFVHNNKPYALPISSSVCLGTSNPERRILSRLIGFSEYISAISRAVNHCILRLSYYPRLLSECLSAIFAGINNCLDISWVIFSKTFAALKTCSIWFRIRNKLQWGLMLCKTTARAVFFPLNKPKRTRIILPQYKHAFSIFSLLYGLISTLYHYLWELGVRDTTARRKATCWKPRRDKPSLPGPRKGPTMPNDVCEACTLRQHWDCAIDGCGCDCDPDAVLEALSTRVWARQAPSSRWLVISEDTP